MEIKQLHANAGNYGPARNAQAIKYIVIHYTGNDGDTAENNARYYASTVVKSSAHYFVDANSIYQSVPDLHTAWAVGGQKVPILPADGGRDALQHLPEHEQHQHRAVRREARRDVCARAGDRHGGSEADAFSDGEVQRPPKERDPPLRRDRQALPCLLGRKRERGEVEGGVLGPAQRAK